jgi:hypothetical protein
MHRVWNRRVVPVLLGFVLLLPAEGRAQGRGTSPSARATAAVRAVVDSALVAINSGDLVALSNLMTDSAQVYGAREEGGVKTFSFRTAVSQRAAGRRAPIIERTFGGDIRIAGSMASVWLPYDLWAEGTWSNCGVDQFTLVQVGNAWRIVNFTYSVEQPPACRMHPDGPPPGYTPPARRR